MKTKYYASVRLAKLAALAITLPIQMQPVAEGATVPQDIEVEDIKNLGIFFLKNGVSGLGTKLGTEGDARYELDGSNIIVYLTEQSRDFTLTIKGTYGEIGLNAVIVASLVTDGDEEVELNTYIFDAIAAGGGGGADYKTDIYMDGVGRVIMERLEDGSTVLLDEHENPILKRNSDGSTKFFDAYQSARLLIDANGGVSLIDQTAGTLAIAEAIMARTRKRLLTNKAGETTIKDEDGNVLTHEDIYAMLMDSPDFVVLVRSDHAFHPNLVTESQIAFTCSYLGVDGKISAERVNITSDNVVTYSQGKGVTAGANGGVAIGNNNVASGEYSHAEGNTNHAEGEGAHAEGQNTTALGEYSHAEGDYTNANRSFAHAEGSNTTASGVNSHAEGEYSTAAGNSSHAEGYSAVTEEAANYSHAEGYETVVFGTAGHAQGIFNNGEEFAGEVAVFMHGCGSSEMRKNAFAIAGDGKIYVIGIGGYDGTNHAQAQDLATVIAGL